MTKGNRGWILGIALLMAGCVSLMKQSVINLDEELGSIDEIDRLTYFEEINAGDAIKEDQLTGEGVRVTLMGESIDVKHPDLSSRVIGQYNTFVHKGVVIAGKGNAPHGEEYLGKNDGHGTHIAGTIAAACDGVGVRGIACGATLDAYDLGAYDNAQQFPSEGWDGDVMELRFLTAFATALDDLTRRDESKIATGSFNLESPAVRLKASGPLYGQSVAEILRQIEDHASGLSDFLDGKLVELADPADGSYIERVVEANEGDFTIALMLALQQSSQWADVAAAVGRYQAGGGVYLVTESNYVFENRTSLLNALPSLDDRVDPDLWLSIVMVEPKDEDSDVYVNTINTCGRMAADYCLVTPSYSVLSTMTERVAFGHGLPRFQLDGRDHQILAGHSMGAPMVAATLALMQEMNDREGYGYSMKELVRLLKDSANRSFRGFDPELHGRGMLDVSAAVEAMKR